jgi:excisionase family DNA binding protein
MSEAIMLTVDEVAKLLNLPRSTTYECLARGEIPGAVRIGRHLRVRKDAVLSLGAGEVRASRPRRRKT